MVAAAAFSAELQAEVRHPYRQALRPTHLISYGAAEETEASRHEDVRCFVVASERIARQPKFPTHWYALKISMALLFLPRLSLSLLSSPLSLSYVRGQARRVDVDSIVFLAFTAAFPIDGPTAGCCPREVPQAARTVPETPQILQPLLLPPLPVLRLVSCTSLFRLLPNVLALSTILAGRGIVVIDGDVPPQPLVPGPPDPAPGLGAKPLTTDVLVPLTVVVPVVANEGVSGLALIAVDDATSR